MYVELFSAVHSSMLAKFGGNNGSIPWFLIDCGLAAGRAIQQIFLNATVKGCSSTFARL